MWQRFTEHARKVVFLAQEEAGKLGNNYVSTEHMLLAILREPNSGAAQALRLMSVDLDALRAGVEGDVAHKEWKLGADMQLTPRAKRAIDLAYDESRSMQHDNVCSEHLLLGLVREREGVAARALLKFDVDIEDARAAVLKVTGAATLLDKSFDERTGFRAATASGLRGADLLDIAELSLERIDAIFDTTTQLKQGVLSAETQRGILAGKTLAMIFEKPSLRTRVSFETGIFQLGGHAIYLGPSDISLGKRESVVDIARTLGRMSDMIMARTFAHEAVVGLAEHAGVPVINGLSDLEHPCQALADFYTIKEKKGDFAGLKLTFVGDGNNVAHSLMLLAAKVGTNFAIACPEGYEPNGEIITQAKACAEETGSTIEILHDPAKAVDGADVVYTDVWASMGQESEAEERAKLFAPFQVNAELMEHAKDDAIFEHCLPAHRGQEVTDEVVDSNQSVVFDEAENRLHVQKAVMALLAG